MIGLALVAAVLTRSLPAYLADVSPGLALRLDPGEANAALRAAQSELESALTETPPQASTQGSAQDQQVSRFAFRPRTASTATAQAPRQISLAPDQRLRIEQLAKSALVVNPLNPVAVRLLGQLSQESGQAPGQVASYMRTASLLSPRESSAVYWMMLWRLEQHDDKGAVEYADLLLRAEPNLIGQVIAPLASIAERPSSETLLVAALAADPVWRSRFFAALPDAITDARTPLRLMLALMPTEHPPTPEELDGYLRFLVARKLHDLAYYAWLQFLSPKQLANTGFVYNGNFEQPTSQQPFDWVIKGGAGTTAEIQQVQGEPNRRALVISFSIGRVEFGGVSQMIMLGPGDYRLRSSFKGELIGRRGLRWRVECVDGPRLGESPMLVGAVPVWSTTEVTFNVPATACRAQTIKLELDARSASEQLVKGSMWLDDVSISRMDRG